VGRTPRSPFAAGRAEVRRVVARAGLLGLAGLLGTACTLGANPSAITSLPSPASTAGYLTYVNSSFGFRIKYPPDWSPQAGSAGAAIAFVSPAQGSSDSFRENVNVLVEDLADPSMSLGQYTDTSLRQAKTAIDAFRLLRSGPATLASRSAERVIYLGQIGRDLKFESVWLVEKGRAYVVTYTATPDAFAGTAPTAEAVIGSFELG